MPNLANDIKHYGQANGLIYLVEGENKYPFLFPEFDKKDPNLLLGFDVLALKEMRKLDGSLKEGENNLHVDLSKFWPPGKTLEEIKALREEIFTQTLHSLENDQFADEHYSRVAIAYEDGMQWLPPLQAGEKVSHSKTLFDMHSSDDFIKRAKTLPSGAVEISPVPPDALFSWKLKETAKEQLLNHIQIGLTPAHQTTRQLGTEPQ